MSEEPEDLTLGILVRIQAELSEIRAVVNGNRELLSEAVEEREALAGYITHAVGLSTQAQVDIEILQRDLKALRARVEALEES